MKSPAGKTRIQPLVVQGQNQNWYYRPWVLMVVIGLVGAAAYLPQTRYGWVYDDRYIIEKNPVVRGGCWLEALRAPYWPVEFGRDPLYRPVTTLSLRACYAVFGDRAGGYRAVNAVLHGLCAGLTGLLAWRLWRRRSAGWLAGLVFAVHPVHTEAVAMVVGRAELLAGVFGLGVLVWHSRHLAASKRATVGHHVGMAALAGLAMGSKEHAVLLVPGIVLMDWWYRRADRSGDPLRARLRTLAASHYLGLILVTAGYLFMRWWIFGGGTTLPGDHVNRWANPLVGADLATKFTLPPALLWLSIKLLVLPVGLCPIWSVGGFDVPQTPWRLDVLLGVVAALGLVAGCVWGMRRRHALGLGLGLAGLFLVLPCHFVPAANWLFAERWLYLASAFAMVVVGGLGRYRAIWWAVIPALGLLSATTWQYQRCWRNTEAMMRSVVDRHPESYHGLIGYAYGLHGRGAILEGAEEIERLVQRFPQSPRSWFYQAMLMDALDHPQAVLEAVDRFVHAGDPQPLPPDLERVKKRALQRIEDDSRGGQ